VRTSTGAAELGGVIQKYGGNYILAFAAMAFVAFVSAMEGWGCWSENRKLEKSFCCPRCCPES
jgi:glyoxylate carboligase